jgi:AcrR family transcriptional regulator
MTQRMRVADRKRQLLNAGIKLAEKYGYSHISRKQVGLEVGVSEGLLSLHFGTMDDFRKALMAHAIATSNARVIAQGLIAGDKLARKAPENLKQLALSSV